LGIASSIDVGECADVPRGYESGALWPRHRHTVDTDGGAAGMVDGGKRGDSGGQ
jgi:hypothetical protein